MSGTQTSAFPDQNTLLSSLSGGLTASVQRNQLLNEQGRQQIGAADLDYASRLAQGVLNITDPSQRAAAYTDGIQRLQQAGFAKNSPLQYPGDAAMQHVASLAIPVAQQYELGLVNPAGLTDAIDRITRGGSAAATPGQGGAAPGSYNAAIGGHEGTGRNQNSTAEGVGQFTEPTWNGFVAANPQLFQGMTPQQMLAARNDPNIGNQAIDWLARTNAPKLASAGVQPSGQSLGIAHYLGPDPAAKVMQAPDSAPVAQFVSAAALAANPELRTMTAGQMRQRYASTPSPSFLASAGAPQGGVAGRYPGAVQTAGPGAGLPTAATDPGTADLDGPRPLPPVGPGSPTPPTPQVLANTPAPVAGAPVQTAAAQPPAAASPQAPAMPPTGVNSPQFQRAMELQREIAQIASYPGAAHSPIAQAQIARLKAEAAANLQADSVVQVPGVGQVHTLTGSVDKPVPHYVPDEFGGLKDETGSTLPPTPRIGKDINGNSFMVLPGGGQKPISEPDYNRIKALHEAEAEGSNVGKDVVKQTNSFAEMQRNAYNSINQIDLGLGELTKAMQGNVQPGKFAGVKNTINAAVKGVGLDPSSIPFIGQDPDAVGAVQVAKKSLAIASGAIIRQAIGGASPELTDAKLQGFIDARPGIENDPQAIFKIMNWARNQFVYEREMGTAAMDAAAKTPTGQVPVTFRARYLADHGGGPIYNPSLNTTEQPDGQAPPRDAPFQGPPSNAAQKPQYVEGQTATGPGGKKAVYRNGGWVIQ